MAHDYSGLSPRQWLIKARSMLHSTGIDRRADLMEEVHELLVSLGIQHWLAMSGLLGIYRDGDLLARDEDVDFYCRAEELTQAMNELKKQAIALGYDVHGNQEKARLELFKDGECYGLMGHFRKGKYRVFKNRCVPERMFGSGEIEYRGVVYPCMSPIEQYLEWQYKNWKKPYTGSPEDRDKYMNKRKVVFK